MRISDWSSDVCSSDLVKQLALERVAVLEGRVAQLLQICETLRHLAEHCHGDERPECPIIDGLAEVDDETPATQPHAFGMSRARNGRERRPATVRDRKSVVAGQSVSVRVDLGGHRIIKKKKK